MSLDAFLSRIRARDVSVRVRCGCGRDRPLGELHMCAECCLTSCGECAASELDTFFCPADLESVPTGTAYGDRNRSQNTADCPLCFCTLATQQRADGKYVYVCEFCKWASPFAASTPKGLLDAAGQRAAEAAGEDVFQRLCGAAAAAYKEAGRDVDPADMTLEGARDRGRAQDVVRAVGLIEEERALRAKPAHAPPKEPVDNSAAAPPAPEWFVAPQLDLERVSTVEQRARGHGTPLEAAALLPQSTALMTKMAHRCPRCNKYTVKPKLSAKHVAYDKRRLAVEYLPSLSLSRVERLAAGARAELVLYVTNPSRSAVTVRLEQAEFDEAAAAAAGAGTEEKEAGDDDGKGAGARRGVGSLRVREEDRGGAGGEWAVPGGEFEVAPYDETDDVQLPAAAADAPGAGAAKEGDEAAGVVFRARNRVGVRVSVSPPPPSVGPARVTLLATVRAADKALAEFDTLRFLVTVGLGMASEE